MPKIQNETGKLQEDLDVRHVVIVAKTASMLTNTPTSHAVI